MTAPDALWRETLLQLKSELSEQVFRVWFTPLEAGALEESTFTLHVPDPFFGDWLRDHYHDLISTKISALAGRKLRVRFDQNPNPEKRSPSFALAQKPAAPSSTSGLGLNPNYTFANFVVGPGNRFAHAAALAVVESLAKQYNPLVIYGRVGLGKTHLMQAIAHEALARHPGRRAFCLSSERFTTQLIAAIQTRTTAAFRQRYRTVDLLLIDDIHFIAGKESTQEEFFHTFNELHDAHKQIVITSDRSPREIPGLEERVSSRLAWGLLADIQPPEFETRVAIIRKKLERESVEVPDDVTFLIAEHIKNNIRELEGAVIRVVARAQLLGEPVTTALAREALKDAMAAERKKISIELIQKKVADYFDIAVSDLRVHKRARSITFPRQIAMYLVRDLTPHSLPEIGTYFGGRDHSTVLHSCAKIERLLREDPKLRQVVENLVTDIHGS